MLMFSFLGQKSRVNNLAMVGSITWPSFWPKFCPERWPSYWPYLFSHFFVKLAFFQKFHSPCRKKKIFEKKINNKKEMAKLLTYDGQVIDPTAYIYMTITIYIYIRGHRLRHVERDMSTTYKGYQNRWFSKWQVLGTFKTSNFGAPANLVHVCVVLWHPKGYQNRWFSAVPSSGDFGCTRNFGTRLGVSKPWQLTGKTCNRPL